MWGGRGWWPDHLVGRAVILTRELADEDGARFTQRSALLVKSVVPDHGKDDGVGWLTPRGIIKGRMIVTVPSNRPDKPELSIPFSRSGRWAELRVRRAAGRGRQGVQARDQSAARREPERSGGVREPDRSATTRGSLRAGGGCGKPPLGPKAPKPV